MWGYFENWRRLKNKRYSEIYNNPIEELILKEKERVEGNDYKKPNKSKSKTKMNEEKVEELKMNETKNSDKNNQKTNKKIKKQKQKINNIFEILKN